tara:strand:+ start:69 stop:1730 length:1662 start_codon:yes stop_codon:yes gene_type:complete
MAVSIDAQAAINEIARDLDRGVGRSRDDVSPIGFYGEHETYGTQADWLTGEGLTSAWGSDPGWGIRSTYSNPVSEYVAEDPTLNTFFIDAGGMLKREEKPGPEHYAALALSMVPVIGPAAVRAVTPLALATKKSIQDWGKRVHRNVDFNIDQPMTATSDATWKATGFRETLQGKILEKLGMLPAYKDLVKMQKNADPMIQGWYDDYVLKGKDISQKLWDDMAVGLGKSPEEIQAMRMKALKELELKEQGIPTLEDAKTKAFRQKFDQAWDDAEKNLTVDNLSYDHYERTMRGRGETPLSRSEWDLQPGPQTKNQMLEKLKVQEGLDELVNEIREGRYPSFDETMKLSDAGMTQEEISQLLDESIQNSSLAKFLASPKLPSKSDVLPENVTQLPGTKPIQDMTWREWDNLSDSPFTLSSKQNEMMRAQGITDPDDVLDNFWAKGARDDFVGWLEEAIAKTGQDFPEELEFVRLRDLKSGYVQTMTDKQFKNDIAWKEIEIEAQKIAGTDPMVVAEKMAFKPDKVTHAEWARLTEELTREEAIDLARRMTLRLID